VSKTKKAALQKSPKTQDSQRPRAALITNHGYAGPVLPLGGAPDTGGQNLYVHNLAFALEALGYDVTIFARGGFPFFKSNQRRQGIEALSPHIRYVYLEGGPSEFMRKENIAVALDEELENLVDFVDAEARELECKPWEVYEFINTHYWDGGILGMGLVDRWKNRIAATAVAEFVQNNARQELIDELEEKVRWGSVGNAPAFHIGHILLQSLEKSDIETAPALTEKVKEAIGRWARSHKKNPSQLMRKGQPVDAVYPNVATPLQPMVAAESVGKAVLKSMPRKTAQLGGKMALADRHVWTPHSLGVLKQEGYVDREPAEQRRMKFCERRHHEMVLTYNTRGFVATSEAIAEHLLANYGVSPEQIFYFPPCVDATIFRPYAQSECAEAYEYLAEKSGIPVDKLKQSRLLFEASRADTSKRKDLLLRAFAQVVDDFEDTYLFIGGGPENEVLDTLRKLRDSLVGLKGRAFILGFVPDEHMGPLFSMAELYVSPSEMEGFGMSAAQAAAARTALICSDRVPFAVQYVPEQAVVVEAGDERGFADAMRTLLANHDERKKRAAALADAVKSLEWTVQTRAFLRYLRRQRFPVSTVQKEMGKKKPKRKDKGAGKR
jgi:glycosyltransferase involved in cell wall biosynthesis